MSFSAQARERSRPVLPLAPMVDVLFLLLIFFMTASVFREQELQIDVALPTAEMAQPPATTATQITISLTADDRIYLGPRELTLAALRRTLAELVRDFPDEVVVVRGDQASSFGLAVKVMDAAQLAGVTNVSVATVKPTEELD